MCQEGVEPDDITFISLLSACSHAGMVDEGMCYYDSMSKITSPFHVSLCHDCKKLVIAFGLVSTAPGMPLCIIKESAGFY
jgi:pentatricopeptide repeat protein